MDATELVPNSVEDVDVHREDRSIHFIHFDLLTNTTPDILANEFVLAKN